MTTNYHTPISNGSPAVAGTFNAPLAELDSAISALAGEVPLHDHTDNDNGGRLPFDALNVDTEDVGDVLQIADIGGGVKRVRALPFAVGASTPSGAVLEYAGSSAPAGWLLCAGQAVSRATYADLFTAIGTTYGVGDGSTTFNLPDLRGRATVGKDDMGGTSANRITGAWADSLGGSGGAETHTLTTGEMPAHGHPGSTAVYSASTGSGSSFARGGAPADLLAVTIASAGGGGAHNNLQPSIALNKIIKI